MRKLALVLHCGSVTSPRADRCDGRATSGYLCRDGGWRSFDGFPGR